MDIPANLRPAELPEDRMIRHLTRAHLNDVEQVYINWCNDLTDTRSWGAALAPTGWTYREWRAQFKKNAI